MFLIRKDRLNLSVHLVFLSLTLAYLAPARTWTNNQGMEIQAELISVQVDKVQLKLENGLDTMYPIADLSLIDQEFIKNHLNSSQKTELTPSNDTLDWSKPLPKEARVNPEQNNIQIISEDRDKGLYVYETEHFIFLSDVKLAVTALRNFSRIFEATYAYAAAMPFFHDLQKLTEQKIPIEVYNFKEDYLKNGGPQGSAGVYMRRGDKAYIKVCFDYLGVKRIGSSISFDYRGDSTTLPHEIVHALTDTAYYSKHMKWFTEGIAEYMSNTDYADIGKYTISESKMKRIMVPSITAYGPDNKGGSNLGETIQIPSLLTFMTQEVFFSSTDPKLTNLNYAVGWLLTYYFIHEHDDGDQFALRQLLASLKEKEQNRDRETTIESLIRKHLLAESSEAELNEKFAKAMKRLGIKIIYR